MWPRLTGGPVQLYCSLRFWCTKPRAAKNYMTKLLLQDDFLVIRIQLLVETRFL